MALQSPCPPWILAGVLIAVDMKNVRLTVRVDEGCNKEMRLLCMSIALHCVHEVVRGEH
jgi:hypothetical protein